MFRSLLAIAALDLFMRRSENLERVQFRSPEATCVGVAREFGSHAHADAYLPTGSCEHAARRHQRPENAGTIDDSLPLDKPSPTGLRLHPLRVKDPSEQPR
jgi:hypothetical protein